MSNPLPLIDVSGLASVDAEVRREIASLLGDACRNVGFFYVKGHGIDPALIKRVLEEARKFFSCSIEEKNRLSHKNGDSFYGYVEIGGEQLDLEDLPDRKEAFSIGLELDPADPRAHEGGRAPNQWPAIPGWRETMLEYFAACLSLSQRIHQAFSLDLGLDETFFRDKIDAPLGGLRLLHYPAASSGEAADGRPGAGEHTDYGNLTILMDNGVSGLELRNRAGEWIGADPIEGALICNIGDCLMRWTNDVYVSTPHRVSPPTAERYSAAFFLDPNPATLVVPVVGGIEAEEKYPAITALDYLLSRLEPTHL